MEGRKKLNQQIKINKVKVFSAGFKVRSAASVLKLFVFRKLNHFHLRDLVSYSLGRGSKLLSVIKWCLFTKVGWRHFLAWLFFPFA